MYLPEVSAYFIATILAFSISQAIKYYLSVRKNGPQNAGLWYQSGNMPSAHTATMVALTTVVAFRDGTESGLFAVTAVITAITMYDSMMARRAAGEQGLAVRKLLSMSAFSKDPLPHQALGHRPLEVIVGFILGLSIGIIVAILITQ